MTKIIKASHAVYPVLGQDLIAAYIYSRAMKFSAKSPLAFARESGSLADFVIVSIDYDMGCPKIWKRGRGNDNRSGTEWQEKERC